MKFKAGDKILCKKSAHPNVVKGEWYEIEVDNIVSKIAMLRRLSVKDPNGFGSHTQIWYDDIEEHFYTNQELRKMKLNEIEGRR